MAFYGYSFEYNNISCSSMGLMIYDFGSTSQDNTSDFVSQGTAITDSIAGKDNLLLYGIENKDTLTPRIVFGVGPDRIDKESYLTRREIEKIAEWLTGDGSWKWLSIKQEDMINYRYKVILSSLKVVFNGWHPYAFEAEFMADSPYAYTYPKNYIWTPGSNIFNNLSSNTKYYKPIMYIYLSGGGDFSITNETDGARISKFTNIPSSTATIMIDNKNQIIKDVDNDLDLYKCFNYNFFRAVKGKNLITIEGNGKVRVECEFPVNVGV